MAASLTNKVWKLVAELVVGTTGAGGTMPGTCIYHRPTTNAGSQDVRGLGSGTAFSIDTTGAHILSVDAKWGTANVNNTITAQVPIFEIEDAA